MVNAAVSWTMADRLEELGHISADRLRLFPAHGTATVDDLMDANTHRKPLCELIDQTLVEIAFSNVSGDALRLVLMVVYASVVANTARHEAGKIEGHLQTSST